MAYTAKVPVAVAPSAPPAQISGLMSAQPQPQPQGIQGLLSSFGDRLMTAPGPESLISTQFLANAFTSGADNRNIMSGIPEAVQNRQIGLIRQQEAQAAEEERQRQVEESNKTAEWVKTNFPQFANLPPTQGFQLAMAELQNQKKALDPTSSMQEYQYAVGQGYDGSFADWKAGSSPQTTINNNIGGTDEFYGQLDKNLATQQADLITAGMNAQSNNVRLGELDRLLQTAPQGATGAMTQIVGSLGIPTEGLDEVQAAQALINQMVPGQRPPGSGTMSDADLALFKASLPQIINQPGGNQQILRTMQAINEYTVAQAQIAQMVANRQISPAEGRRMQMEVPNPLAGIQTQAQPAPAANDPLGLR